eukprot:592012-Heterocapsa_arctica.AAC.1
MASHVARQRKLHACLPAMVCTGSPAVNGPPAVARGHGEWPAAEALRQEASPALHREGRLIQRGLHGHGRQPDDPL